MGTVFSPFRMFVERVSGIVRVNGLRNGVVRGGRKAESSSRDWNRVVDVVRWVYVA